MDQRPVSLETTKLMSNAIDLSEVLHLCCKPGLFVRDLDPPGKSEINASF